MPPWLKIAATLVGIVFVCVLGVVVIWIAVRIAGAYTPASLGEDTSQGELVTTILTGLTVSIALLALVLALMAIVGYYQLQTAARRAAGAEARTAALKYLKGPDGRKFLRGEIESIAGSLIPEIREGIALAYSQTLQEAGTIRKEDEGEAKRVGRPRKPDDDAGRS